MRIQDIVDVESLKTLCEKFTDVTGMVTAILDLDGNVLVATGWQDVCTKFHRVHPTTAERCRESDTVLAGNLLQGEAFNVYRCRNGLIDVAVPIKVGGEHIGNFFTGQFFFTPPDTAHFARQADEFGFDRTAYLSAISKVQIFSEEKVRTMTGFLVHLTQLIGDMGMVQHRTERESHRNRILFDESPDGILVIDPATARIVEFNSAAHRQLGYTREEFAQLRIPDVEAKETPEDTRARIDGALASGRLDFETVQRTKNGELRNVLVTAQTVYVEGERVYQCVWRDITARKKAEEALDASSKLLQTIIATAPVRVFWKGRDLRYLGCNLLFAKDAGLAHPEEIVGKCDLDLGWRDQAEMYRADDRKVIDSGVPRLAFEEPQTTPTGDRIWLRTSKVPLRNDHREIIGVLGVYEDVTEQKKAGAEQEKLKSQLDQARRLEAIGTLAGGVAHDFNNMLGVIIGNADLSLENIDSSNPLHENIAEIRKAAVRSSEITRQLLAFARKQPIVPKVVNLDEVVESTLKMLRRLIGEDIEIHWVPVSNGWTVNIDPSQLDQVLANLATNARDSISGVGKIVIETRSMTLDQRYCQTHPDIQPGEYVCLSMTDTGKGIDKDDIQNIFEPFFTTKEVGKGTGLGLSTVYGIVRQNQGFINVHSEVGQGTTFRIYLPRVKESKDGQVPALGRTVNGGTETLLVVEDEEAYLNIVQRSLSKLGYTVLSSTNPKEAIRIVERHQGNISLLVTDVIMPGMNGRELAEALSAMRPDIKHLFVSGYTSNIIADRGVISGEMHFLQKPHTMSDLATMVRKVLDA